MWRGINRSVTAPAVRRSRPHPLEVPTVLLSLLIHGSWFALTWWWSALPLVLLAPLGATVIAWHGSLQHEAVHGHPSGRPWVDQLVAGIPLWLWLPFSIYRESHLAHHATGALTDPTDDPESYYVAGSQWQRMNPAHRLVLRAMQTLVGRLVLGPAVVLARFARNEARAVVARGDWRRAAVWTAHLAACALVMAWVVIVCEMPAWVYLACFVYPGLSLTLLRSFVEHRPAPAQAQRTAVVEAGRFFSLLFLHNNLHSLHHASPGVPWYRLPALYRARKAELLAANGGYFFAGYGAVARRYAVSMKDEPTGNA
jgi:fatty acid desaturase